MFSEFHLHREPEPPALPASLAASHAVVVVLFDAADTKALRCLLAGRPEVRLIRYTRRKDDARVRADVECLAGSAQALIRRLTAASGDGTLRPITSYVGRDCAT